MFRDLLHNARGLLRNPVYTLSAALSLAIGIGANATIFSVVNTLLFRPLPVKDAHQLIAIAGRHTGSRSIRGVSFPDYLDYRERASLLSGLLAAMPLSVNFSDGEKPERLRLEVVNGEYFSTLGVNAVLGRTFTAEETKASDPRAAAVISYNLWTNRFARDRAAIGRTVKLNGYPFTIIGVLPETFAGERPLMPVDAFVPASMGPRLLPEGTPLLNSRAADRFRLLGRLKPGVTVEQARSEMNSLAAQISAQHPETNRGVNVVVTPELRSRPDPEIGALLPAVASVFLIVVGLVLVVACLNVMTLMLARTISRGSEFALRVSLGASRFSVIRLVLLEGALLAAVGGVLGLVLARWAVSLLASLRIDAGMPLRLPAALDWRVLLFTAALAMLAALASSIIPALEVSSLGLGNRLKEESRTSSSSKKVRRLRVALLVSQIAISLMVLVSGALFFRSLSNTRGIDLGFRTDNVYLFSMDLGSQRYEPARTRQFYNQLLANTRALPGVSSAALAYFVPLSYRKDATNLVIEGQQSTELGKRDGVDVYCNIIGLDYFKTAGVTLRRGRDFTERDGSGSPPVAIISEAMARRFWPGQNPLEKRFRSGADWVSVVGVAGDTRFDWLYGAQQPYVYFPMAQRYIDSAVLYVQASPGMREVPRSVRGVIGALDNDLPVFGVESMTSHIEFGPSMLPARVGALFMMSLGGIGVLLVGFGVYAVISHLVAKRACEMGIRMALGADRPAILRLILGQSLAQASVGVAIGLAGSFALAKLLSSLLFGVSATDPLTWALCSALLLAAVFAAAFMPANRVSSMHPMLALRHE